MQPNVTGNTLGERPLTYGEKAVGLTFNPANDPAVHNCKVAYAGIIDQLNDLRNSPIGVGLPDSNERNRLCSIAITEAQGAQMFAVKAITNKY